MKNLKSVVDNKAMQVVNSIERNTTDDEAVVIEKCKYIPKVVNVLKDVAIKGIDTIDKGIGVAKDISKDTIKSYDDCTKAILEEAEKDEYGFEEKKELYSAAENIVDKEAIEGDKLRSFIIEVLPWAYRTIIAICVTTCAITGAKSIIPLFATDK